MEKNKLTETVQYWIIRSLNDPIAKILHKNSHLTKIQLETLLIDLLAENISGKELKYDKKAKMRIRSQKISRGSFNRTLKQAKNNAVKAIYTLLLLGYLGLFEDTTLTPYLEIANKLTKYRKAYGNMSSQDGKFKNKLKMINTIREDLELTLKEFANL